MPARSVSVSFGVVIAGLLATQFIAGQNGGPVNFRAALTGYEEVPSVSTNGAGSFRATLRNDSQLEFELEYSNLSGAASMAHVHFGRPGTNGGIVLNLCGGPAPACPPGNTGTAVRVTRTLTASDVVAQTGQGIAAGEFAEVIAAMRAGATYVNVHTPNHPGGEIRGQVRRGGGVGGDEDDDDQGEGKGKGKGKGNSGQ